ncbi:hypothetical protein Cgig2_027757 [Carnegiea gigantea]|uniref:Uncharacterized protein n=1 Tax=Carnegiea gigantea TaxID=171969 RepID=A0A9Q1JX29_9CARY|nr:hypothetical protein Cgig2_027757 [Carnegiea gigantea]
MSIALGEPVAIVISEGKPQVNIECSKDNNDFEGRSQIPKLQLEVETMLIFLCAYLITSLSSSLENWKMLQPLEKGSWSSSHSASDIELPQNFLIASDGEISPAFDSDVAANATIKLRFPGLLMRCFLSFLDRKIRPLGSAAGPPVDAFAISLAQLIILGFLYRGLLRLIFVGVVELLIPSV